MFPIVGLVYVHGKALWPCLSEYAWEGTWPAHLWLQVGGRARGLPPPPPWLLVVFTSTLRVLPVLIDKILVFKKTLNYSTSDRTSGLDSITLVKMSTLMCVYVCMGFELTAMLALASRACPLEVRQENIKGCRSEQMRSWCECTLYYSLIPECLFYIITIILNILCMCTRGRQPGIHAIEVLATLLALSLLLVCLAKYSPNLSPLFVCWFSNISTGRPCLWWPSGNKGRLPWCEL